MSLSNCRIGLKEETCEVRRKGTSLVVQVYMQQIDLLMDFSMKHYSEHEWMNDWIKVNEHKMTTEGFLYIKAINQLSLQKSPKSNLFITCETTKINKVLHIKSI